MNLQSENVFCWESVSVLDLIGEENNGFPLTGVYTTIHNVVIKTGVIAALTVATQQISNYVLLCACKFCIFNSSQISATVR